MKCKKCWRTCGARIVYGPIEYVVYPEVVICIECFYHVRGLVAMFTPENDVVIADMDVCACGLERRKNYVTGDYYWWPEDAGVRCPLCKDVNIEGKCPKFKGKD